MVGLGGIIHRAATVTRRRGQPLSGACGGPFPPASSLPPFRIQPAGFPEHPSVAAAVVRPVGREKKVHASMSDIPGVPMRIGLLAWCDGAFGGAVHPLQTGRPGVGRRCLLAWCDGRCARKPLDAQASARVPHSLRRGASSPACEPDSLRSGASSPACEPHSPRRGASGPARVRHSPRRGA